TGQLAPGVLLAPPEGDAGTGMVATNTITPGCGNVSVGTSIFAMVVTTKPPTQPVPEIDVVATPDGHPVAMVHCNNGASELGSWSQLLADFTGYLGVKASIDQVFSAMMAAAVDGADDGGGWLAYNYLAGEPVVGTTFGWPLVVRLPEREAKFADFARAGLYGVFATLRIGMELLRSKGIQPERLLAHGGLFKTPVVAQRFLAAALNLPVTVGQAAGDGGSWGMAVLANYRLVSASGVSLSKFLAEKVMANAHFTTLNPEPADVAGFNAHLELYKSCLALERTIDLMERSQDR
ncbi:MAG: FGGY-family carbohydrate kinase, partial [Propionibacteriaceae bacterium]|nr:FGGY-family carbohydrate kinase [Propionibacteriaceae bacterium]